MLCAAFIINGLCVIHNGIDSVCCFAFHALTLLCYFSFADKMIEHKNSTYAVIFYKLIYSQLIRLHDCSPKVDTDVNIKFNTDGNTFEAAIKQIFGSFSKSSIKVGFEKAYTFTVVLVVVVVVVVVVVIWNIVVHFFALTLEVDLSTSLINTCCKREALSQ